MRPRHVVTVLDPPPARCDGGRSAPSGPRRWSMCRHRAGVSWGRIDHRHSSGIDGVRYATPGRPTRPQLNTHPTPTQGEHPTTDPRIGTDRPPWIISRAGRPNRHTRPPRRAVTSGRHVGPHVGPAVGAGRPLSIPSPSPWSICHRDTPANCRHIDHRLGSSGADRPPSLSNPRPATPRPATPRSAPGPAAPACGTTGHRTPEYTIPKTSPHPDPPTT